MERLLGPAVEDVSIAPTVVKKISEGPIDQGWVDALKLLDKRSKAAERRSKESEKVLATTDVKPLMEDLTKLVSF